MWITRKRWLSFGAGVAVLLMGVPALAASDTFKEKAIEFYQRHCTRGRATGVVATLCYLFDKTGELDAQLKALTDRVGTVEEDLKDNTEADRQLADRVTVLETADALQSAPLKVFDADGNELGLFTWSTGRVFSEVLAKHIIVDPDKGEVPMRFNPTFWFETRDCSGAPFLQSHQANDVADQAWKAITGKYYVVDESVTPRTATALGQLNRRGDVTLECLDNDITFENVRAVKEVTLPFPDPFATPLKFLVAFE